MSLHSLRILDTLPEERFDRITRMAQRFFDVEICLVSLVDSNRQWFKSKQGLSACETSREVSFCGHAILKDEAFVIEDALNDGRFADNPLVQGDPKIRFYSGYPVHGPSGERIGTLCLIDSKPRRFTESDEATLVDFACLVDEQLAISSEVHVDALTGVANRRGFESVSQFMLPLCQRNGLDIELLFFDLDKFKQLNDTMGHKAGDEALTLFAKALLKCFRAADVVARLGGDEFVVLMAGKKISAGHALERLKQEIQTEKSEVAAQLQWSVGRIKYEPDRHADIDALLADADGRMYANKSQKRAKLG